MIGPRIGIRVGVNVGAAVGVSADELGGGAPNPMASVTRDASSGIYCPANSAEWTTTLSVAGLSGGNPGGLWLCQELSGNLADSIGANPLVVSGSPTYQNSNAGWTRKSVNITATTVQQFALGTGVFNPAATSVCWLGYCCLTGTPGGNRTVFTLDNGATILMVVHNAANKLLWSSGVNNATSVNNYTTSTIFPLACVSDLTHSTQTMYTGLEALPVTFGAVTDGSKGLGAVTGSADSTARWAYLAAFSGAAAEFTTANMRALFTTLNWSPAF